MASRGSRISPASCSVPTVDTVPYPTTKALKIMANGSVQPLEKHSRVMRSCASVAIVLKCEAVPLAGIISVARKAVTGNGGSYSAVSMEISEKGRRADVM